MDLTERLSSKHWKALIMCNMLLTLMTTHHAHYCECELCQARMLTDTQDEESRTVTYTPAPNENN